MKEKEIIIRLDVLLAHRKMSLTELSEKIDVPLNNISIFKNGRGSVIRIRTLLRLCEVFDCTPNDILEVRDKNPDEQSPVVWRG